MKKLLLFSCLCATLLLVTSCHQREVTGMVTTPQQEEEEEYDPFVDGNKKIVALENEEIDLFLQRYGWETQKTGTGLRIQIVKEGSGEHPVAGESVTLKYKMISLSGDILYQSSEDGEMTFIVDKSNELTGLHEAVKMMKVGGTAKVVIPSHLAFGVGGDGNRIVGRQALAMYLELVNKNNNKNQKSKLL